MKIFLSSILTLLYLLLNTGISASLHYCHGQFKDLALFEEAKSCCLPEADENSTNAMFMADCCETDHLSVDIPQLIKAGGLEVDEIQDFIEHQTPSLFSIALCVGSSVNSNDAAHFVRNKSPLYLLFSRLVFYG